MQLDPTKDELLEWVKDIEAISKRTDLTSRTAGDGKLAQGDRIHRDKG
jgi:hypothetical protein